VFFRRHVGQRGPLAQLQSANVGNDRPAIARRNLRRVRRHSAKAVGDNGEEIPRRRVPQAVAMKRGRTRIAPSHNHAVAVACPAVTRRAENIETLLTPFHHVSGNRKRKCVNEGVAGSSGIEKRLVIDRLAARHRARRERARRLTVGEKRAGFKRIIPGLVGHLLPAGGQNEA